MIPKSPKLYDPQDLARVIRGWQLKNQQVVFTNGCFDILHPGHIMYLEEAKALGNRLVVGLNSDESVRAQGKDPSRPVNNQEFRCAMLSALHAVDAVVIFKENTPLELIKLLEPDILVKGGDYSAHASAESPGYIVGAKEIKEKGGQVMTIPLLQGYSTTTLLEKWRA